MPENDKKLFLLDAFALIYRSYFAFSKNPRMTSKGENTSAVYGFVNTLIDLLQKEKPTHIGVVFDAPGPTFRVDDFADYKAHREEMPEGIRWAIPHIKDILTAFNIPILILPGYEADDIIGTIAKKAEKKGYTTYMMTPDKDFGQLVSENIFMYKPGRGGKPVEIWGVEEVKEKFQVEDPIQVIDILGLWGDAVDNIPGIPGIGEKTAKKLIKQYGSVEGLIAHSNELKGKQQENVIKYADQGLLSKKLATIILDVPLEFEPDKLIMDEPNKEELIDIFKELEFRTTLKRLFSIEEEKKADPQDSQLGLFSAFEEEAEVHSDMLSIADAKYSYELVKDDAGMQKLEAAVSQAQHFCFDTETSGLDPLEDKVVGIAFSTQKGKAWYVDLTNDKKDDFLSRLRVFLEDPKKVKVAQNLKFDRSMLIKYNIDVKAPYFDTMVAHYLISPEMNHGMDFLAEKYLNYKPVSIEELIGKKGRNQLTMDQLEPEKIVDYACEDADITLQLFEIFKKDIDSNENLSSLFYDLESPLISVLGDMEMTGIKLDVDALAAFSKELTSDLLKTQEAIFKHAEEEFNIDSPKQLGIILFEKLKVTDKPRKTKTGQYATGEDVLTRLKSKHPIMEEILEYRQLKKLKSTYVDALPKLVSKIDGRIHTTYMQTVAATGRLSSNNPNLQNIPIRTKRGREIRKSFIPSGPDYMLLASDYSQIELRIIAALSEDKEMVNAFNNGEDIHAATASKVFGVPIDEVSRDMRSKAKAVNFGIIYGQSAFGLAENLNIKRGEAKELIDNYFEQYPNIKKYMDKSIDFARKHGYVETIMGRKRYLPDINSANQTVRGFAERNAINAPIQGSAADIIKRAMVDISREMKAKKLRSKMLLQVHDELVFDLYRAEEKVLKELVKDKMENAFHLSVPLLVEMEAAENWLEAH
jgi:DNA polymerase-1